MTKALRVGYTQFLFCNAGLPFIIAVTLVRKYVCDGEKPRARVLDGKKKREVIETYTLFGTYCARSAGVCDNEWVEGRSVCIGGLIGGRALGCAVGGLDRAIVGGRFEDMSLCHWW